EGGPAEHADQYSLALMFQELLTGTHAFRNLNPRQMANPRQRGNPDLSMLSSADRVLVGRALHPDPAQRFATCSEVILALAAVPGGAAAALPGATGAPTAGPAANPVPQPRRPPVVIVSSAQAVNELTALAAEGCEVHDRGGIRYLLTPQGSIL